VTAPDGPHLSFPFRIGADGRAATVRSLDEHVRDEVVQLVLTSPGERAFLPELGGGVRRLVFEHASDASAAVAKATLAQALAHWLEHRAAVGELRVDARGTALEVGIGYRLRAGGEARLLRFRHEEG
jgi:phage baseplate assembly protein W